MLINTENYFEYVSKLGVGYLSAPVKKMHDIITRVTDYGKDWSKYTQFKSAWDKQFEIIELLWNEKDKRGTSKWDHVSKKVEKHEPEKKEPVKRAYKARATVTEEDAHQAAIKLIEGYVKRGDSFESIKSGQMGSHNGEFSAMIKGQKIFVDRIKDTKVNFSFTLKRIFDEIKAEMGKGREKNKPGRRGKHKPTPFKKPNVKGKNVELVSPEVIFIKRFALLHGKQKNKQQVLNFIKAIQKAIVERRIRKNSKYAKVIGYIQAQLVNSYNSMEESISFKFSEKDYIKYLKMAGAEHLMPSVRFIKSYINMLGQSITKQKAANLLEKITGAIEKKQIGQTDKYMKHLRVVIGSIERFLKTGDSPSLTEAQLSGLEGVLEACGCSLRGYEESYGSSLEGIEENPASPRNMILNSKDVINLKQDKLDFQGKWRDFIGNPSKGFTMMIYGKPKYGKSYLAVDFAGYLARNHGRVLYVAREEGFDDTLQDKLREKDVAHDDLDVADHLPKDLSGYEFVFLDSINRLDLSPEDIERLEKKYPAISFIYVFQTNKGGDFKGSMEFKHNVDSVVEVPEKGLAIQYGRYNQGGEMRIFEG